MLIKTAEKIQIYNMYLWNRNRLQRQRVNAGQECLIRDEFVNIGETVKYAELCVQLICQKNGNVDVRSMPDSECRRRKSRNKWFDLINHFLKSGKTKNIPCWPAMIFGY